ncbi:MAG: hypothetical protein LBB90_09420 [Tannerella sp.]|nr:hypothetical protein [Tannerella sp.]
MHSLPHHHHFGEAICFATECCEDGHDGADAAGELSHQHHSGGSSGYNNCSVEDSYLFSFEQNETNCKAESYHHDHHTHTYLFFASCCLAAIALLYEAESADDASDYGGCYACFYQSINANRDNGLRAPPRLVV